MKISRERTQRTREMEHGYLTLVTSYPRNDDSARWDNAPINERGCQARMRQRRVPTTKADESSRTPGFVRYRSLKKSRKFAIARIRSIRGMGACFRIGCSRALQLLHHVPIFPRRQFLHAARRIRDGHLAAKHIAGIAPHRAAHGEFAAINQARHAARQRGLQLAPPF